MKKSLFIISALFFVLLIFNSCKQHKIKTATEQLIGTWTGSIEEGKWCDTNNYNTVVLELQENNVALLNYSGDDDNRWNTPYECKWWVEQKKVYDTYKLIGDSTNYYFLYISVKDTLCDPCNTLCGYFETNCYLDWTFPDTASYRISKMEDTKLILSKSKSFKISNNSDLLFSKWNGNDWFGSYIQTLNKQN